MPKKTHSDNKNMWPAWFFQRVLISALVATLCWSTSATAQSLLITDCQGFTRALEQVDPGSLNQVDVEIAGTSGAPANGVEVTLTNAVSGEATTVSSTDGVASFGGIGAGTYAISSSATDVIIGGIVINSGGAAAIVAGSAGLILGGGVVAGAAVIVDDAVNGGGNNSGPTEIPTAEPSTQPTASPNPTSQPTFAPTPVPTPDCDCDPNETPTPLSPFR